MQVGLQVGGSQLFFTPPIPTKRRLGEGEDWEERLSLGNETRNISDELRLYKHWAS